jgi:protein ImuB
MNPRQQQLFGIDHAPSVAPAALRAATPATAAPRARQLWVAVQSGELPGDLVRRAQGFTPRVAVESSDALLLELAGSLRLFGGLRALLAALRAAFPRPLRLALAPTPLAAVVLARAGCNCCILSSARLKGRLAPLPLAHLGWTEDELRRLESMGVRTLAELLRLPRAGLARRLGPERLRQLDRLTGARADPRPSLPQPEGFHERIDPDCETFDRERLLAALQPSLERLEIFLRERARGVTSLRLRLHHRGAPPLPCVLRCVVPEYRAARFTALLAARLEALVLAGPVRRMELTAGRLRRFLATSSPLWAAGEQGGQPAAAQAPELLQTLLARLGDEAVYSLAEIDEHRPERQQRRIGPVLAADANARRAPGRADHPAVPPAPVPGAARPLGLLDAPQPLEMLRDAAGHVRILRHAGRELTLLSGPERIESGWWDEGAIARDYYVARAADGARWWIFRECGPPRRWFLHGCFA